MARQVILTQVPVYHAGVPCIPTTRGKLWRSYFCASISPPRYNDRVQRDWSVKSKTTSRDPRQELHRSQRNRATCR